jgi:hypothetical protein
LDLGDGDVNCDGLFAGLHLLLVGAVAKLAFDLDVSALRRCLRLATLFGPFRRFNLAHPKLLIL